MRRHVGLFIAVVMAAACAAPNQPTPTPSTTSQPSPGCGLQSVPTPAATPSCTQTAPPATSSSSPSASPSARPTPTPTPEGELTFNLFAQRLGSLTFLTHAGDGTGLLYAVEQDGRIVILDADGTVHPEPFLDISARITAGGERGLLGLAFHPGYADNGRLYVDYTDLDGNTVVSEFLRATDTTADPDSERVIFTVEQPFANHNGGMVAFGPDGALYVGMGDGGSGGDPQGNGQNPDTLLAKLVRVDVDAAPGPPSEPQIWDSGLRNPWRFSFDRQSGDLWIGDVGQGQWEEIDAEPAGQGGHNYGWNIMEGNECYQASVCDQTDLTLPVVVYSHGGGNCSVTGGYVYRGSAIPDLVGTYLYADYCTGRLYGIDAAAALAGDDVTIQRFGALNFNVSAFGEDENGELFIVDHNGRLISITAG